MQMKTSKLFKAIVFIECLIPLLYMFIMRDYMIGQWAIFFLFAMCLAIDVKIVGDYIDRNLEELEGEV